MLRVSVLPCKPGRESLAFEASKPHDTKSHSGLKVDALH